MKRCHVSRSCVAALWFLGTGFAWGQETATQRNGPEGAEVLTHGPVHEAFAGTISFNPEPGIVAPKAPPEAIEELPPEQRSEGTNVAWIPGYWAWDDERNDFLWVSGIWRDLPPGRQWVPGYWDQSAQGVQWISGYWADAQASEMQYLPEPPQSVENGPNIEASSADQSWLPGCWIWQQNRYAWRPGYWAAVQPDWVWIPANYVWTPRGFVFVDGYWDYSVARRGVVFAPVYFQAPVYSRPGFLYSPTTVINPAVFLSHLFLRPNYHHYYFGDYYAASYSQAGFYPGYSIHNSRRGYDPIYAHQRWQHRQDRDWERGVAANFQRLRENESARPPRTWTAQKQLSAGAANDRGFVVAAPLAQLINTKDNPLRFQPLDEKERQRLAQHGQEVQKFRQERQKLETGAARPAAERPIAAAQPARVKFPTSPILAQPADQLGKGRAPPKVHEAPKLDAQVEPRPRVARSPEQSRPQSALPPQPGTDRPTTPQVAQPLPRPQPQPRVEQPAPKPQAARPAPKPQANQPAPKPQAEQPAPRPQSQPRVAPPQAKPEPRRAPPAPQPRVNPPQPQPKVNPPQPQPKVNAPQPQAKPQPQPQPQPKPKVNAPQPQPQPKVNAPQPQAKPQPQPQPKQQAKPATPPRGPSGPAKQDKPKGKDK